MKLLRTIGDALVERLVPKADAGACCVDAFKCWNETCGVDKVRRCCLSCQCVKSCGACHLVY